MAGIHGLRARERETLKQKIESLKKAALVARLADDKKAENIKVLDLRGLCNFADYFIICTANSRVQLNAISHSIDDGLRSRGMKYPSEAAMPTSVWLVMDCGDVVAHIMTQEARDFYHLERLWGDARDVDWEKIIASAPELIAD